MIYQATDVVNFAQGEMAMFSTYLAWSMLNAGLPYWVAFTATLAIACGLAALVGAVAGMMVAPIVFLDPNMMAGILIYAFASATLGGFTSPGGAVVGGLLVGVIENLVGTYVRFIGTELKLTVALAIIIIVLVVKPSGLFGRVVVRRV